MFMLFGNKIINLDHVISISISKDGIPTAHLSDGTTAIGQIPVSIAKLLDVLNAKEHT
jgi:hypothetical protein